MSCLSHGCLLISEVRRQNQKDSVTCPPSQVQSQAPDSSWQPPESSLSNPMPAGRNPKCHPAAEKGKALAASRSTGFLFPTQEIQLSIQHRKHWCFLVNVILEVPESQYLKKKKNHVGLSFNSPSLTSVYNTHALCQARCWVPRGLLLGGDQSAALEKCTTQSRVHRSLR